MTKKNNHLVNCFQLLGFILGLKLLLLNSFSDCQYQFFTHESGRNTVGKSFEYGSDDYVGGTFGSVSLKLNTENEREFVLLFGKKIETAVPSRRSGEVEDYYEIVDQIWKYSVDKKKWSFLKGRKYRDLDQQTEDLIPNWAILEGEADEFDGGHQIAARFGSSAWINHYDSGSIITIFGGYIEANFTFDGETEYYNRFENPGNDLWRYNVSSGEYAAEDFYPEFFGLYSLERGRSNEYHPINRPSGRYYHLVVQIDEDRVFMIGGIGFIGEALDKDYGRRRAIADYWMFSNTLRQWKHLGESLNDYYISVNYEEKNVYSSSNTAGSISGSSGVLINKEEILIFGGTEKRYLSNFIQKYNISSNQWKYVSGNYSEWPSDAPLGVKYGREYDNTTYPGSRKHHKIWKISNDELLLFGGYGYASVGHGVLADEFRYSLERNEWKFTGKYLQNLQIVIKSWKLQNSSQSQLQLDQFNNLLENIMKKKKN